MDKVFLKLNVFRINTTVIFTVIEQIYRNNDFYKGSSDKTFQASNGLKLRAMDYPDIYIESDDEIFVYFRGLNKKLDNNVITQRMESIEEAMDLEFKLNEAVKEYNLARALQE